MVCARFERGAVANPVWLVSFGTRELHPSSVLILNGAYASFLIFI